MVIGLLLNDGRPSFWTTAGGDLPEFEHFQPGQRAGWGSTHREFLGKFEKMRILSRAAGAGHHVSLYDL